MPQGVKGQILDVLPFKKGNLLVRYLGLPLISGRLRLKDYLLLAGYNSNNLFYIIYNDFGQVTLSSLRRSSRLWSRILIIYCGKGRVLAEGKQ